jgi:hypothetical protein
MAGVVENGGFALGVEEVATAPMVEEMLALDRYLATDSPGYRAGVVPDVVVGLGGLGKVVAEAAAAGAILRTLRTSLNLIGGPMVAGCTSDPSEPEPFCTV